MKHILSAQDISKAELDEIFEIADVFAAGKNWNVAGRKPLEDRILGTLFFEPSTRTRWSTEVAMMRLGGQVLSMEYAKETSSDRKGEILKDTLKTCSQYVDALIVRHPSENVIHAAAPFADCPIINGGDGSNEHPTQALLDVYTIMKHFKNAKNLKIMFTGDMACSRTIHSLVKMLEPWEPNVTIADPNGWPISYGSTTYAYQEEAYEKLPNIDILYMTRHQTERIVPREKSKFIMTNELASTMKKDAIIMHPLPRSHELPPEIDRNPRAKYFEQVKNGIYVRQALLLKLLRQELLMKSPF